MEFNYEKRKVMLTETILRDAHQSQAATRMRIDEMLPVLEQLDEIGYYSIEAWSYYRKILPRRGCWRS